MITLRTLHLFPARTIFLYVVRHLLRQNEPAMERDNTQDVNWLYRTAYGKRCAVGCLIADDEYTPDMEYLSVMEMVAYVNDTLGAQFMQPPDESVLRLLDALQAVHDSRAPCTWPQELLKVAQKQHIQLTDDERNAILTRNLDHEAFV